MTFVLDNSVALTWCFEEERTAATEALLEQVGDAGAIAPMLWPLEALNGLLVAERRGRLDADRRRLLTGFLSALPIKLDEETAGHVWTDISHLAERFGLSRYDAAYLELATPPAPACVARPGSAHRCRGSKYSGFGDLTPQRSGGLKSTQRSNSCLSR